MGKTENEDAPPSGKGGAEGDRDLSDEASSSDDDDDLGLEGVLVRNPDASSSSSSSSSCSSESSADEAGGDEPDGDSASPLAGRGSAPSTASANKKKRPVQPSHPGLATKAAKKQKKKSKAKGAPKDDHDDDDLVHVDFTFHDMNESFYDGLKALLHNSGTVYQPHSGNWVDLMVDNVSVGTLISTDGDVDRNVYGFASVLPLNTYRTSPAVKHLIDVCLKGCPAEHRDELREALEGGGKKPTGALLHGRMINLPLEITLALHQQLLLDLDWAVKHAEGGPEERQSLDFATIVRVAPCQLEGNGATDREVVHRYFDDELFHGRSHLSFVSDAPKSYSKEQPQKLQVSVLTASAFRLAVRDLERMVGSAGR